MHGALDRLLTDATLHRRLTAAAGTIQEHDGVRQAATLIQQAAAT
jgi:hypothetical protein